METLDKDNKGYGELFIFKWSLNNKNLVKKLDCYFYPVMNYYFSCITCAFI